MISILSVSIMLTNQLIAASIIFPVGNGIITTLAGTGVGGFSGDGGLATSAQFQNPVDVAVDENGDFYISDANNFRIRKVDFATGLISTVVGTGVAANTGDGGPATSAEILAANGLAVKKDGSEFYLAMGVHVVRAVNTTTNIINTVAGTGVNGFSGDGGLATSAQLNGPQGIDVDLAGNLYIADSTNDRIRKVTVATGIITTVAGNGTGGFSGDGAAATSAQLNNPEDVAVNEAGTELYIADTINNRIRKVDLVSGIITTVFGDGTTPILDRPPGLALNTAGKLYISDKNNERIRSYHTVTGAITTVAGTGTAGYNGDGGGATGAQLNSPRGVAVDISGNLYIADLANNRLRGVGAAGLCGDGTIQTPNTEGITEQCDDNNLINGDGCSNLCFLEVISGTTDAPDGRTVRVAVNGVLDLVNTGTTSSGSWSVINTAKVTDDIITVFIDGVSNEIEEAVAVSKYLGSGQMTGLQLLEEKLTIGSADNASLTNADLALYDNSVAILRRER